MPPVSWTGLLLWLRSLPAGEDPQAGDAQILNLYIDHNDQEAFTTLMQRHGPMVLTVCQRWLNQEQDVEDAFQATFLILAKKASTIRKKDSLASWLHGVALRVAQKLSKKKKAMAPIPDHPENHHSPLETAIQKETAQLIDEAIQYLPDKYQHVIILCDLQSHSHEQAAQKLNCPIGSISWRLQKGRDLIRSHLTRKGAALSASVLSAALTDMAQARVVVPEIPLTHSPAMPRPTPVAQALADQVIKAMAARHLLSVLLFVVLFGVGGVIFASPWSRKAIFAPALAPMIKTDRNGEVLPPGAIARMGTKRLRHPVGLRGTVVLSPDQQTLFSFGGADARQWDLASGREIRRFPREANGIRTGAISPNGKTIATLSQRGRVVLRDVASGRILHQWKLTDRPDAIAFTPNNKYLAVGGRNPILSFYSIKTGRKLAVGFEAPGIRSVYALAFSPNGNQVLTVSNKLHLWDIQTGKLLRAITPAKGLQGSWRHAQFSEDGSRLLTVNGVRGARILLWSTKTWQIEHEMFHRRTIRGARLLPDTAQVLLWSQSAIPILIDLKTKEVIQTYQWHQAGVLSADLSSNGKRMATLSQDSRIQIWDMESAKPLHPDLQPRMAIESLAIAPNGKTIATGGSDFTICIWEVATGKLLHTLKDHQFLVTALAYSPNGKWLASCCSHSTDTQARVWNVEEKKVQARFHLGPQGAKRILFLPDSKTVVTAGNSEHIRFWDPKTGKEKRFLMRMNYHLSDIDLSPNGKMLLSTGWDLKGQPVRIWDMATGKILHRFGEQGQMARSARFLRDNKIAMVDRQGEIQILDIKTKRMVQSISQNRSNFRPPEQSPQGNLIAYAEGRSHTFFLQNLRTNQRKAIKGHDGYLNCLQFAPNGNFLATGSKDGTCLIWDLELLQKLK